jgi:hypothetical protein
MRFASLLYLTLLCFIRTLRVTAYFDFGFSSFGHLWAPSRAVLRGFVPYQLRFIALHIAYAASYSCQIRLIPCLVLIGLYVFEITVTACLVHVREKRQRDKWE